MFCSEPLILKSDLPDEFRFVSWPAAFIVFVLCFVF